MTKQASEPASHDKPCTLCGTPRAVLVRCQIDESGKWNFVCPGKCWKSVSGGEIDAKGHKDEHPYYRYGGMWKNRHEDGPLNAKKPKRKTGGSKTAQAPRSDQAGTDDEAEAELEGKDNDSEVYNVQTGQE